MGKCKAVYPYIPTSNRNFREREFREREAVYPYIPTSNRNRYGEGDEEGEPYILIFLHQTATHPMNEGMAGGPYILIFLHQTATWAPFVLTHVCRISLYSYIKPQPSDGIP